MNEQDRLLYLTGRELQTFNLIVCGKTTREISKALGISVHTAEYHRRRVYEKLYVNNVAKLVQYAAQAGWFSHAPAPPNTPVERKQVANFGACIG